MKKESLLKIYIRTIKSMHASRVNKVTSSLAEGAWALFAERR